MHAYLTLYFVFCIFTTFFYPYGAMTTILLVMLFFIHQYFFYLLYVKPPEVEPASFCTECKQMTTNSYVHCKKCEWCYPVTYFHWDDFETCVSREHARRYRGIVFLQLIINLFCSIVESVNYPPFLFIFVTTAISCKSIMSKLQVNI